MQKGKFYYGSVGVGKTSGLKKEFEAFDSKMKRWITARHIALAVQAEGLLGVERLVHSGIDLFIDDLGHEPNAVSHFGAVLTPMAYFIQSRYDNCQESPQYKMTTHFTSNLSPEELRVRYGDYIFDRLVEMCEWVHVKGESFRK